MSNTICALIGCALQSMAWAVIVASELLDWQCYFLKLKNKKNVSKVHVKPQSGKTCKLKFSLLNSLRIEAHSCLLLSIEAQAQLSSTACSELGEYQ